jgi:hypothetical protein
MRRAQAHGGSNPSASATLAQRDPPLAARTAGGGFCGGIRRNVRAMLLRESVRGPGRPGHCARRDDVADPRTALSVPPGSGTQESPTACQGGRTLPPLAKLSMRTARRRVCEPVTARVTRCVCSSHVTALQLRPFRRWPTPRPAALRCHVLLCRGPGASPDRDLPCRFRPASA